MSNVTEETTGTYESIIQKVFSGQFVPGARLVERDLAKELGVSRHPVRETLGKMAAQGILVGGKKGQGVWMREYKPEEVRQLYELREVLEGAAAAAAARSATESDLTHLEIICEQMEAEAENFGSSRWAELDRKYHETMVDAGHNERFAQILKALLTECYYVFYVLSVERGHYGRSNEETSEKSAHVIRDHRDLLELVRQGKATEAEEKARKTMRESSVQMTRRMIATNL